MQDYLNRQWKQCLEEFSKHISSVGMDLWISPLQPINLEADKLVLLAPAARVRAQIYDNYLPKMREALRQFYNVEDVYVITPEEKEDYIKEYNAKHPEAQAEDLISMAKPTTLKNPFNSRYTFDNFVVGTTNQVVYAAARKVAERPGEVFNPLFIYGGVGLGKTHLLHAIGNHIWEHKTTNLNIIYVTCEQFTNDFLEALRVRHEKGMDEFRKKYRSADVFLVDDIQFISNKKSCQEEFFNTFNSLYQGGKQIIISSDRPPREIQTLEERLSSRFSSGLVQEIEEPDFETRLLIIQKKIEMERYEFEKGIDYILAERLENFNIREIEAILRKIQFLANFKGRVVATHEHMNEVLDKDCEPISSKNTKVTQDKIIATVCEFFNVDKKDLLGRKRTKEIVEPRQYCIYLMWSLLAVPLSTIGQLFSRDHTTIIHARDKIMELTKTSRQAKKIITELTATIKS